MPNSDPSKSSYHHGDLERALVEAGLQLIEERGLEALSIRSVAQAAGVSHAAPYHHFSGKTALLAAIATAGFQRMTEAITEHAQRAQSAEPLQQLRAVGCGYVHFAIANPEVFRLMFRPELTLPAEHPQLREAESQTFGALLERIVDAQKSGDLTGQDPLPPACFAWSSVHGLSLLAIDNVLQETPIAGQPIAMLIERINDATVAGLAAVDWSN